MRITYDPEADARYIELKDAAAADNIDLQQGLTADRDAGGSVIGILDARRRDGASVESIADELVQGIGAQAAALRGTPSGAIPLRPRMALSAPDPRALPGPGWRGWGERARPVAGGGARRTGPQA